MDLLNKKCVPCEDKNTAPLSPSKILELLKEIPEWSVSDTNNFISKEFQFEKFVAELLKIADKNIAAIEVTRPRKDGGRDAIGQYKLQIGREGIFIDFAVEAKCYGLKNSVGVKEISRLISRLRYRQFGLLVTTSYVADQAYKEIREDGHPIVVISGGDIVDILVSKGINTKVALQRLLNSFGNGLT